MIILIIYSSFSYFFIPVWYLLFKIISKFIYIYIYIYIYIMKHFCFVNGARYKDSNFIYWILVESYCKSGQNIYKYKIYEVSSDTLINLLEYLIGM